jgi:hypothetical protein
MGLFDNWFKGKPKAQEAQATRNHRHPSERSSRYDAGLVANLRNDHRELAAMYGQLGQSVRDGDYTRMSNALLAFRTRLEAHLLMENVRLYAYLEQTLADDGHHAAIVGEFRREMKDLVARALRFVQLYQQAGVSSANVDEFMREYDEIGKLLMARVEREEGGLYPLYSP